MGFKSYGPILSALMSSMCAQRPGEQPPSAISKYLKPPPRLKLRTAWIPSIAVSPLLTLLSVKTNCFKGTYP